MTFPSLLLILLALVALVLIISQAEDRGSRLRAFLGLLLGIFCSAPLLLFVVYTVSH